MRWGIIKAAHAKADTSNTATTRVLLCGAEEHTFSTVCCTSARHATPRYTCALYVRPHHQPHQEAQAQLMLCHADCAVLWCCA